MSAIGPLAEVVALVECLVWMPINIGIVGVGRGYRGELESQRIVIEVGTDAGSC